MKVKYYIASQIAEEISAGVVALTEDEYNAVTNFLTQVSKFDSRQGCVYCGACNVMDTAYNTREEAQTALNEEELNGED